MISLKDAIYELNHNIEFKNARMVTEGEVAIYLEELQRYIDLEKQGRLIELPCAVGDTVYVVEEDSDGVVRLTEMKIGNLCVCGSVYNGELWNMYLTTDYMYSYKTIYDIGRTVFLTKAEAEAALKESEQE